MYVLSRVLIFCKRISKLCRISAMLFHVDIMYLFKQAKNNVKKSMLQDVTLHSAREPFYAKKQNTLSGEATTVRGPGCDKGTTLRLRDIAVVPLMPIRTTWKLKIDKIILFWYPRLPLWHRLEIFSPTILLD